MHGDLALQAITAIYAVFNTVRLVSYVPQISAVARESTGAHAISLTSWLVWTMTHAVTAVYGATVLGDPLLASMMCGNVAGCFAVVALTVSKRRRYGWVRHASPAQAAANVNFRRE